MNKKLMLIAGAGIAAIGYLVYFLKNINEEVTVEHLTWKREVDIEEYKQIEETGTTVPEGATVTHVAEQARRIKDDIKKVICYTYVINKWVKVKTAVTTGNNDKDPYYNDTAELPEGMKYADKRENYYVVDTNGNTWTLDYPKWCILRQGDVILIKHRRCNNYISKLEKLRFETI